MKRREIIEFEVGKMEFGGTSSTVIGKRNVNMKGGITGQKVKASVKKANSQKAEVKLLEVLEKSPLETEQACKHFGQCGGCTILYLPYEKQLELKKQQILDLFESHEITGFEFLGIESSPNNTCYRNKMEFTFGNEMKDGPLTIGMHKKGRHIDILTVDGCMLIDQDFIKILTATEEFFRAEGLPYYRGNDHKGYLRHLVVRKGIKTNEMMVMIVTSTQLDYDMDKYKDMLLGLDLDADLASVLHCLNDNLADAVKCDELRVLHGRDHIYEELLGRVEYIEDSFNKLIFDVEDNVFMSPSSNILLINSTKVFDSLTFIKKEIDKWYQISIDKNKMRVCLLHNNLELDHYLKNKNDYLISWESSKIDTPIIDIVKLYKKVFLTLDFIDPLKTYLEKFPLNDSEMELLYIMLALPDELILTNDELKNVKNTRIFFDYIYKTENLIKNIYKKD